MQKTYIVNQKNKDKIIPAALKNPINADISNNFLMYHGKKRLSTQSIGNAPPTQLTKEDILALVQEEIPIFDELRLQEIISLPDEPKRPEPSRENSESLYRFGARHHSL